MSIQLDHVVIPARDKQRSAEFLAGILGLKPAPPSSSFTPLRLSNGVTLDFMNARDFRPQHCAFRVDESEFDSIFDRIRDSGTPFYADPGRREPATINHRFGGRGVYFDDPDGHLMEVLTRPGPDAD